MNIMDEVEGLNENRKRKLCGRRTIYQCGDPIVIWHHRKSDPMKAIRLLVETSRVRLFLVRSDDDFYFLHHVERLNGGGHLVVVTIGD